MQSQISSQSSLASQLASLPKADLVRAIQLLTPQEAQLALKTWQLWRRPNQTPPAGDWSIWLVQAGRGFGKTRIGAEWVRDLAETGKAKRIAIVARTASDHVKTTIEGESGILAVSDPAFMPRYIPSKCMLKWPNGVIALTYTADEPDNLRGPQHDAAWADEVAAWRYDDAWDQLMFGLRLGNNPQCVVTTTPRPTKLIREMAKQPGTAVTRGSTYDNRDNLAPKFFRQIIAKYEGTRLGRQELEGAILDDNPNALWKHEQFDAPGFRVRLQDVPDLVRIVTAVDPSVTSNPDSDACGIGAAGIAANGHLYVLEDATLEGATPAEWGKRSVECFHDWESDRMVAETNQGGDLVEMNIRASEGGKDVPFKKIHASRGKTLRAEPVAGLYEQGRVHHVGVFPKLEDELCDWNPTDESQNKRSPNRMDWLVYALTELAINGDVHVPYDSRMSAASCVQTYSSPATFG